MAKNAGSQWPVANHSARCTSRGVCGIVAMALIIFASVMLPAKWEQLRAGHWALEHFLAYFAAASIVLLRLASYKVSNLPTQPISFP